MAEVSIMDTQERKLETLLDLNELKNKPEDQGVVDNIILESDDPEQKAEYIAEEHREERLQAPHRRKKRPHPGERIGQYAHKAKTYETAANMLFEQNKSQKDQIESLEREKQAYKEHALQLKADYAKEVYEKAAEDGDIEKQSAAHNYMTQYNTELTLMKNKDSKNYNEDNDPENLNEFLNYVPVPKTNMYAEEWINENSWFDRESPYYDPEMAEEAMSISSGLDRELKRSRRADLIGTPDYFDTISDAVREKFNIQEEEDEEREEQYAEPPREQQRQHVAPVSRSSGSYSNTSPATSPRTVTLNAKEKEMALKMDYGTTMTAQEKIKKYADSKYQLMKSGQLYK